MPGTMLYLSELIGRKIVDPEGNPVARIRDVVATFPDAALPVDADGDGTEELTSKKNGDTEVQDAPVVQGLLARSGRMQQPFYVPIEKVKGLEGEHASLSSAKLDLQPYKRREGEILLTHDLWDKQVIDLQTRRVVRVNDVTLGRAKSTVEGREATY